MLASAQPGAPGIPGGSAGFSRKPTMRPEASTSMIPKALASARGTSTQAMVTSAPLSTCSSIIGP